MAEEHSNAWAAEAIRRVRADGAHTMPTPVRPLPLPAVQGIDVHLKDEAAHPHGEYEVPPGAGHVLRGDRQWRAHGRHAGDRGHGRAVAVAGARFSRLLGLAFTAVVPARTSAEVLARIGAEGGWWQVGEQPPAAVPEEARALAGRLGGHFLDTSPTRSGRRP